jgi:hypothetical protein
VTDTLEQTAQGIADRGREALVDHLRPAFDRAAELHGGVMTLNAEQRERMVQHAVAHADGVQWRRALAEVASRELGIDLVEAMSHPAVARAQAIVGAPSYEESLAKLDVPKDDEEAPAAPAVARTNGPLLADEPLYEDDESLYEDEPPLQDEQATEEHPAMAEPRQADAPAWEAQEPVAEPVPPRGALPVDELRIEAVHLGGVENLSAGEEDIELRLSDDGLDIIREPSEMLGRLSWLDIRELAVPAPGRLRLLRRESHAYLVVRADDGDASFEIRSQAPDELRAMLAPLARRHGHAVGDR